MASVRLDGLTKVYADEEDEGNDGNEIVAVDDLDLDVRDGEFLVLVGPSGCGKSTTLRSIAGLETPTDGEIRLDDTSITDRSPSSRNIAMVFQNYALYPHMTVRENMSFGLKMSTDLSATEIDEQVVSATELMGIEDLLEKKPRELSGGQQQRVALGRAIVRDPDVFLMDEPLSNLDAKLRTQMRTELQNLQRELDVTTIYVTHDQTEAMTMSDRLAILDGGELQQVGTPLECYYQPTNRFVAGFIGSPSMNFMDVAVDDDSLIHEAFSRSMLDSLARTLDGRDQVTIGIRPKDIEIGRRDEGGNESPADDWMTAVVTVVEPMGDLSHVYLSIGDLDLTATVDGERRLSEGESVAIRFPEEKLHCFNPETGEALRTRSVPDETRSSSEVAT